MSVRAEQQQIRAHEINSCIYDEWNILKEINMVLEIINNNLDFQSMPGSLTLTVAIINLSFLQSTALSLVKILSWSLKLIHLVIFYSWRFSIDLTRTKIFFINSPTWIAQRTKCQIGAPKIDQSISKRAFELNAA